VAAMNLLMAHRAVLKHRGTQIVKRRRHDARNFRWRRGENRVTLQAYETDVGARQHPGIRRAMRLMTGLAAFKAHRRMLECEGAALVAVAFEAPRFVGREALQHNRTNAAVRIMAVHAAHRAFAELVMEWALELGPLVEVTTGAQLIGCIGLAKHQRLFAGVHFMASRARDLIVRVAAFEPPDLCGLIQMTAETDFVGSRSRQIGRILNIAGGRSLRMRLAGTVTGLTLATYPSPLGVDSQRVMWVLGQTVIDAFVTNLAGIHSRVAGRKRLSACPERRNRQEETEQHCLPLRHFWISGTYGVCSASTANCAPAEWQTLQLSPNESVFARKCEASSFETWHPLQAEEMGPTGLIQP
jgi:hypothetical protein